MHDLVQEAYPLPGCFHESVMSLPCPLNSKAEEDKDGIVGYVPSMSFYPLLVFFFFFNCLLLLSLKSTSQIDIFHVQTTLGILNIEREIFEEADETCIYIYE